MTILKITEGILSKKKMIISLNSKWNNNDPSQNYGMHLKQKENDYYFEQLEEW